MTEKTVWETLKAEGNELLDQLRKILEEGNARRVVIRQKGHSVAEFPLTLGLVGAVVAPVVAAIGTLVALLSDCSIEIERVVPKSSGEGASKPKRGRRSPRGGR